MYLKEYTPGCTPSVETVAPKRGLGFPPGISHLHVVGTGAKALLVEDDEDTIRMYRDVLSDTGIDADGCQPDRLPDANGFGLVITDLGLGGQPYSGSRAKAWVRMLGDRYGVPVMVVTGHSEAVGDDGVVGVAADVILKPLDVEDLQRRVAAAFKVRAR